MKHIFLILADLINEFLWSSEFAIHRIMKLSKRINYNSIGAIDSWYAPQLTNANMSN